MKKTLLLTLLFLMSIFAFADDNPLWMRYSVISPDGNTIVFAYQGDLFTVPAAGGEATLLTYHEAYDSKPVWSPDSKYIAFASRRYGGYDIFLVPAEGGKAVRLTTHSGSEIPCSFSPDAKEILFGAIIQDDPMNVQFPTGVFPELYKVSVEGGRPQRVLTTTANNAVYSDDGKYILYYDSKGYEDHWRKHHTSAVTRDIWLYNSETGKHRKLSQFEGEDMDPVFAPGDNEVYFLSEQSGSFNVWKQSLAENSKVSQISFFDKHPIRFLSISDDGMLCFGFNGEIYTGSENGDFTKVPISITNDERDNPVAYMKEMKGVTEIAVSPDGNEVAFIIRGEVFVTSTDYVTTKRITSTPQQERSVSFSPDGRSVLYASERDSSWNIYQTSIVSDDESSFALSTILKEKPIIATEKEEFQPRYSPDGKEVAYLEEREILKVVNIESGESRMILPKKYNYSYADGDQGFSWSPDGKWLLVEYSPFSFFQGDIALVDAEGKQEIVNLTNSGYGDSNPKWMMGGKMMIWYSDREGYRSHGSWGSEGDIYGMFFTKEAFDKFKLSKEERALLENKEK
jgi:tricorn protease